MDNLNLDKILEIVNNEKEKKGLEEYVPCYPMLRVVDNKLYIAVLISNIKDNVWNSNPGFKASYWCLIDINSLKIIEFNKTNKKDYIIKKTSNDKLKEKNELIEFEENKKDEYIDYLLNNINKSELSLQKDLFDALKGEFYINNKKTNINNYIMDNLKEVIEIKVKEIVDILVQSKYSLLTIYYDNLFNEIVKEYKDNNSINLDKIKLCIRIMNNYYYGIIGIDELFNI